MSDFILNGGLLGLMHGYDHRQTGRPYGFPEFGEDIMAAGEAVCEGFQTVDSVHSCTHQHGLTKKKTFLSIESFL